MTVITTCSMAPFSFPMVDHEHAEVSRSTSASSTRMSDFKCHSVTMTCSCLHKKRNFRYNTELEWLHSWVHRKFSQSQGTEMSVTALSFENVIIATIKWSFLPNSKKKCQRIVMDPPFFKEAILLELSTTLIH